MPHSPPPAPMASGLLALVCAPIFLAPLLAGLSQAPLFLVPVLAALWLVWQAAARPAQWRQPAVPGLALGGLWLAVLAQGLAIALIFALGRGLSGLVGGALPLPLWVPVALAASAIPPTAWLARRPGAGARAAGTRVLDAARVPADQGEPAGSGA